MRKSTLLLLLLGMLCVGSYVWLYVGANGAVLGTVPSVASVKVDGFSLRRPEAVRERTLTPPEVKDDRDGATPNEVRPALPVPEATQDSLAAATCLTVSPVAPERLDAVRKALQKEELQELVWVGGMENDGAYVVTAGPFRTGRELIDAREMLSAAGVEVRVLNEDGASFLQLARFKDARSAVQWAKEQGECVRLPNLVVEERESAHNSALRLVFRDVSEAENVRIRRFAQTFPEVRVRACEVD